MPLYQISHKQSGLLAALPCILPYSRKLPTPVLPLHLSSFHQWEWCQQTSKIKITCLFWNASESPSLLQYVYAAVTEMSAASAGLSKVTLNWLFWGGLETSPWWWWAVAGKPTCWLGQEKICLKFSPIKLCAALAAALERLV